VQIGTEMNNESQSEPPVVWNRFECHSVTVVVVSLVWLQMNLLLVVMLIVLMMALMLLLMMVRMVLSSVTTDLHHLLL
jgi:hypothetical protein